MSSGEIYVIQEIYVFSLDTVCLLLTRNLGKFNELHVNNLQFVQVNENKTCNLCLL